MLCLFRHFYGLRGFNKGKDRRYGAVAGVLQTVLQIIENESGPPYLGVATDHVIESFRNRVWADYKTGAGIEPALHAHFIRSRPSTRMLPRWQKFTSGCLERSIAGPSRSLQLQGRH